MEKHEIFTIVQNAILEVSPFAREQLLERDIEKQDTLFIDLGINSIDYAEIASIIMNQLNIDLALDIFTGTNHIGDVVDIFSRVIENRAGMH